MAAIFDFQHTQTSDSTPTCLCILPDPENMGISVGISLLSCIEAEMYVMSHNYFWLMAAIFDFKHTQTSDSIPTSLCMLPDPKNMGIAVGISLLSCTEAEIYVMSYLLPVWRPPS